MFHGRERPFYDMARNTEYTHPLRLETPTLKQEELHVPIPTTPEELEAQMNAAELQMEAIRKQQEEIANRLRKNAEINQKKQTFDDGRFEVSAKMSRALKTLDHELVDFRQELVELEECRTCFATHLSALDRFDFEKANEEQISGMLERANAALTLAEDEFEQAVGYFMKKRSATVFEEFAGAKKSHAVVTKQHGVAAASGFWSEFRRGLAFNLPLLILGFFALMIWMRKG